jgi:hypothetical protein
VVYAKAIAIQCISHPCYEQVDSLGWSYTRADVDF